MTGTSRMPRLTRRPVRLLAAAGVLAAALLAAPTQQAHAFGTYGSNGQSHEHERITRAALSCDSQLAPKGSCFEPASMSQLAGNKAQLLTGKGIGAVGAPDRGQITQATAHCDNADYLDTSGYGQTRAQATKALQNCIAYLQDRFGDGGERSGKMAGGSGALDPEQVSLDGQDCNFIQTSYETRAKCKAIDAFGDALHGIQDFYAHGNWTDRPDQSQAVGIHNPPGLDRSGPSPLLDLTAAAPPAASAVPKDFSTGCYSISSPTGPCPGNNRVSHYPDMNKDNGQIDPVTGATSSPTTTRGKVVNGSTTNFDHAVKGAIAETQRQWTDLQKVLKSTYGDAQGARFICALTHDNPVADCR